MANESLTVEEIRPRTLVQMQQVALRTDIGRMLSRYSEFVEVCCPACGSLSPKFCMSKNSLAYVTCSECATLYMNPRPSETVLDWFYRGSANYKFWNDVVFPSSEAVRREKIFVPRVDRVIEIATKFGVEVKDALEVGAGFGTFCAELMSRNFAGRVVAVEPTPILAETCRSRGIEVIEQPVEKIQLGEEKEFDLVANFEVIEHLFSPIEFVSSMARLLRPGGLLVLTCPNGLGFDIETLGPISDTIDHEHLNYFNPKSLPLLLSRCGLETVESATPGRLDADLVRQKVLSGDFNLAGQHFLERVLIEQWETLGAPFQQFLIDEGLSSNMWVVARKAA